LSNQTICERNLKKLYILIFYQFSIVSRDLHGQRIFCIGRKWPIITGAGFGLGMAYSNCEQDLNASIRQQKSRSCKPEEKK